MSVTISGGGGVKSVQRGTVGVAFLETYSVTIAPVNPEKAVLEVNQSGNPGSISSAEWYRQNYNAKLVNGDTVEFQRILSSGSAMNVNWQVIEYA